MADAGSAAKVCASCAVDVSNAPRTKDAQGRYFCKPCVEKLKAKAAAPKAAAPKAAVAAAPSDNDVMGKLLADSPGLELCPNCGGGITSGAMICVRCGYNKETGKAMKVRVENAPKEKTGGKAIAKAGSLAAAPAALVMATVGALVCGAIGAGVWYALAMNTHREFGWIAWGVGALTGFGAAVGARSHVGAMTGLIAAAISAGAVMAGKYMVVENIVGQIEHTTARQVVASEEHAIGLIARDVAKENEAAGKNYQWPEDVKRDEAMLEEDFPPQIWTEAKAKFDALDEDQKSQRVDAATAMIKNELHGVMNEVRSEGFAAMFGPIDILFFLLAVASAFSIGAGAKTVGESFRGD